MKNWFKLSTILGLTLVMLVGITGVAMAAVAPVISKLTPNYGKVNDVIQVTGSNFGTQSTKSAVQFNLGTTNTKATIVSWSASAISVKVPNVTTGNYQVFVQNSAGSSAKVPFTVLAVPVITTVNPTNVAAGSSFTITGTGFSNVVGKVYMGTYVMTIYSWSDTSITAVISQAVPPGTYSLKVANQVGQSNAVNFTVQPPVLPPVITNISPLSAKPGDYVNIIGTNFGTVQGKVYLGTTLVSITSWTDTVISFRVPTVTPGAYPMKVANSIGESGTVTGFTVLAPTPEINGITVLSAMPGASVGLVGTNFGTTQGQVLVGTTPASIISWSDTNIMFTVPALTPGTYPIKVVNSNGESNVANFTVQQNLAPTIYFNDNDGYAGWNVLVSGTNLSSVTSVSLIGATEVPLGFTKINDTSLASTIPADTVPGTYQIKVTNPYGSASATFIVVPTP